MNNSGKKSVRATDGFVRRPRPVSPRPTPTRTMKTTPKKVRSARPATSTPTPSQTILKQASHSTAQVASKAERNTVELKDKKPRSVKRLVVALVCAAACIFALGCFIKLNIPTISVHVAAMQAGIEASYPSYVPHDFSLSSVHSDGNKVIINFKSSDGEFTLTEEKSSWDSSALLNNFVKPEWKENYSIAREQGITIYVSDSNATWVNGGLWYRISADNNTLSKKQIYSLATSL